jgi:cobalt/nickel transport system ATP-binding protein
MEDIIRIENLSYTYNDGTKALERVNLLIARGEKVGIIGANGAGKSTLILHFNGLLMSNNGAVEVCGLKVNKVNLAEIRRRVGMVFQNPDDQLFCPTLYDDAAFGLRNFGFEETEISLRVQESLNQVGLKGMEYKGAFHMSFGEKKRASLATVLVLRPEILVLDEPTSNLDPKGVREIVEILHSLSGTQVIVSHDLFNLAKLVEKVFLLAKGEIIAQGDVNSILNDKDLLRKASMV